MEGLKDKVLNFDLLVRFEDSDIKVNYQEVTKEMFPGLFEEITASVEKALNKQMEEANQVLQGHYLDHNENGEMIITNE